MTYSITFSEENVFHCRVSFSSSPSYLQLIFWFRLTVCATLYTIFVALNFFHVPTCLACLSWFRAGPYHASTTIIAQMIILFKGRRKRKYQMTFAKRVFMFFNVFHISRLLIIDQVSYTRHAQHLSLQMQIESRCLFFFSLFLSFFYSSLFHYLFKGFFLPCFFNETPYFSFSSCTIFYSSREHVT